MPDATPRRDLPPLARLPLAALAVATLIGGVLSGLARLGWTMPTWAVAAVGVHGALMISAFFGAVISLERAVALGRRWAYQAPLAAGLAGVALLTGAPTTVSAGLAIYAAVVMVAANILVIRQLTATFTLVLGGGALCWLAGNLVWLATEMPAAATPWWFAFLVLTIAGERLELSRFIPTPKPAQRVFTFIVVAIVAGCVLSVLDETPGLALFAGALLALSLWLLRYDIAWRNARMNGLPRFIALCLLSGYVWLAVAGGLGLAGGFSPGHPWRDGTLHALGLGFVFSMVFGHAPIILPAVARIRIPYRPLLYLPLVALHATLLLRVGGGLADDFELRRCGAMANAIVLVLFFLVLFVSALMKPADGKGASR